MYCVFLNRVERDEIIKNIKTSYAAFNMAKNHFCHIIAVIDPQKDYYKKLSFADAFIIDSSDVIDLPLERLDEFAMDIVELKKEVAIRADRNDRKISDTTDIAKRLESYGVSCRHLPAKLGQPDLKTLSSDDVAIIFEFFDVNCKEDVQQFNARDFLFKYEVENNGSVYYLSEAGRKKIADLNEDEFAEIFAIDVDADERREKLRKAIEWYKSLDCFTDNFPNLFLFMDSKCSVEEIINYKAALFNLFKNAPPEDYVYLPKKVIELMLSNGFIPIDELKSILTDGGVRNEYAEHNT